MKSSPEITPGLREEVKKAVAVLRDGGIIVYPTDTVWGIGCDATNEDAVRRILSLKNRLADKGLIVLLEHTGRIPTYVRQAPDVAFDLIDLSENPLTIVFDNAHGIAPSVITDDGTIGIRIPHDEFCRQLAGALRKPLVSTSANTTGNPAPASFSDIAPSILKGVDYVVNLHRDKKGGSKPSKIIRIRPNGEIAILRG